MVMDQYSGNAYGHVAYVVSVSGSSFTISHANWPSGSAPHTSTCTFYAGSPNQVSIDGGSRHDLRGFLCREGGSLPNAPTLTAPKHESHYMGRPILDWEPVAGATKYQVRIGTYDSPVVTGTSWRLNKDLTPKAGYWWKVRAGNSAGWSDWSPYPRRLWLAPYTEMFKGDATTGDATHNRWGWDPHYHLVTTQAPNGEYWEFKVTGNDSQLNSPSAYFGRAFHQVDVEIANHTQTQQCQVFWRRSGMSAFDSAHKVTIPTTKGRSVVSATCYFHDDIVQVRLDPVAGAPGVDPDTGGDPTMQWYRIGFRVNVTHPDWSFDVDSNGKGWWWSDTTKFHSIDNTILPQDGVWRLRITGSNPYMVSPPTSLTGSDWSGVEITMRNASNSSQGQFYWMTSEMTAFDSAHSVTFDSPNDNTWRTIFVPLSMSGAISDLRFDPSQGSSGDVYIERIRLVPAGGIGLNPIGDKVANEGQLLEFTVSANSASGGALTLSASNLPAGATFVQDAATSGTFSWTPSFDQGGTYPGVHFEVTDGTNTATEDITISVGDVNRPPVMDPIGDKSVLVGSQLWFALAATDPDGDPLSFTAQNLPPGASFSNGTFSWYPGSWAIGTYDVTFEVSDGRGGSDSETITITVASSLYTISVTADPPGSGSLRVGSAVYPLPWSGQFPGDVLIQLEAIPAPGASFSHWSGALMSSVNPVTIGATHDQSITAHFITEGRVLSVPEVNASVSATSIQVPVSLDDATGIAGVDFTLRFDPTVVQCQSVISTEMMNGFALVKNINNTAGTCVVSMGSAEGIASGSGPVVIVDFAPAATAAEGAYSQLDLDECHLYDETATSIPVRPEDGSINLTDMYDPCDVNRDRIVSSADAILLLRASVGLPAPDGWDWEWPPSNDVNGDGSINSADAIIVLRVAVGLQDSPSGSGVLSSSLLAQDVTPRVLTIDTATVSPDGTALVALSVDDATGIAGADFEISFDPEVIQFVAVYDSGLTEDWLIVSNADNENGTVSISLASAEGIPSGSGALLLVEFAPVGDACDSSVLTIASASLFDEAANAIENVVQDGRLRIDFLDVNSENWAHDQIMSCVEAGVVMGYPDGTSHPDSPVTRDQMAVYISRALAGGDTNVPSGPGTATFADVPTDHLAFKYVEYCYDNGVVQGYWDGYHPDEQVDRAQMAVYVARAVAGGDSAVPDDPDGTPFFPDVAADFWAYKYIEYCHDHEIVQGYWDGYHPERVVTRDQMAVYVQRAFRLPM